MKNIAVFFGGKSVEHDISIITGVMALNSLDKNSYNAIPVYIDKRGEWFSGDNLFDLDNFKSLDFKKLKKVTLIGGDNCLYQIKGKRLKKLANISCAVNCMHGERGEDGALTGVLEMSNIAYASPKILPSSVSMDKVFTKIVMKGLGINTLEGVEITDINDIENYRSVLKYPLIVKPNRLGSSIGIGKADNEEQLISRVRYALKFGESVLLEPCLNDFIEINCACYKAADGKIIVSECERPVGANSVLTFEDKYEGGKRVFPADIEQKLSNKIKKTTAKIYQKLRFSGVIRVDYFISDNKIFVNEINAVPGSLAYYLFGNKLSTLKEMLSSLIECAEKEFSAAQTYQTEFSSGVIYGCVGKGAKAHKKD